MPNYVQLSRYYLDDKDLEDLIAAGPISSRFLVEFLRRRGIFVPEPTKDWTRDDLVRFFIRQPMSWRDIAIISHEINTTDRGEKEATCKLSGVAQDFDLSSGLAKLQTLRATAKGEVYQVTKKADGSTAVRVAYTEVDPHQSRPFQKRERVVDIEIKAAGGEYLIRHSSSQRASQIVEVLSGIVCEGDPKNVTRQRIEFPGLKDPVLRTEFFTTLMEKVPGFRVLDVEDVKVGNQVGSNGTEANDKECGGDGDLEDDEDSEQAQAIKGLIKRAAFSGNSVLTSDIYRQLRVSGYFITSLHWKGLETESEHEVQFRAEMADPIDFCDFRFDIAKVHPLKPNDESFKVTQVDLRRLYVKRMQEAAYTAKAIVDKKIEASAKPPQ